jgi:hypothetical protein
MAKKQKLRPDCCSKIDKETGLATPAQLRAMVTIMHCAYPDHPEISALAHADKIDAAFMIMNARQQLEQEQTDGI